MSRSVIVEWAGRRPGDDVPVLEMPLSKSISNRLLIINTLGHIDTPRRLLAECDDTEVMQRALSGEPRGVIDVAAAGTAMRFLTAYYAVIPGSDVVMDGSARMRQRPIGPLVDALRQAGADIEYLGREGYPPLHVRGRVVDGGAVEIDAGVSSQYISALLMAAPAMTLGMELTLKGEPVSQSYIMMTLNMMAAHGARIELNTGEQDVAINVRPGLYREPLGAEAVEGDWSAASYWYEAVALTGCPVALGRLSQVSLQGDAALTYMYEVLGVTGDSDELTGMLTLTRCSAPDVEEYESDMNDCPDLAQTVMATCCGMGMPFSLSGLSTLAVKETDRVAAMAAELGKLGYRLTVDGQDAVAWDGVRMTAQEHPVIETYKDHRMAMSLAPLAAVAGPLEILDPDVVNKSYPDFWRHLEAVGYKLTFTD